MIHHDAITVTTLQLTLMLKLHGKGSTCCGHSDISHSIIFHSGVETVVHTNQMCSYERRVCR